MSSTTTSSFERALRNILVYTAFVVPGQMALGLLAAVVVNQKIHGRPFFRAAFYFPSLASSAAIVAIFIYLLNVNGLVNAILGTNITFFSDSDTALPSIMGLVIWTTSGTVMLFYLAALQSIPPDVYEAAAIDGSSPWRTFWKITFPLLKPGALLRPGRLDHRVPEGVRPDVHRVRGHGRTELLDVDRRALHVPNGDQRLRWGYAATIGVALFAVIFVFTLVQRLLFGRAETS